MNTLHASDQPGQTNHRLGGLKTDVAMPLATWVEHIKEQQWKKQWFNVKRPNMHEGLSKHTGSCRTNGACLSRPGDRCGRGET